LLITATAAKRAGTTNAHPGSDLEPSNSAEFHQPSQVVTMANSSAPSPTGRTMPQHVRAAVNQCVVASSGDLPDHPDQHHVRDENPDGHQRRMIGARQCSLPTIHAWLSGWALTGTLTCSRYAGCRTNAAGRTPLRRMITSPTTARRTAMYWSDERRRAGESVAP